MQKVIENLGVVLANTYSLYLKTQNYHWNVTGANFAGLHKLFEGQYEDLAEAVDTIAERIRALGELAPGSFKEFEKLNKLKSGNNKLPWEKMVKELRDDNIALVNMMQKLADAAQKAKDDVTFDLMVRRMDVHQKNIWMLGAHLG